MQAVRHSSLVNERAVYVFEGAPLDSARATSNMLIRLHRSSVKDAVLQLWNVVVSAFLYILGVWKSQLILGLNF